MNEKKKSPSSASKKSSVTGISAADSQSISSRLDAIEEKLREQFDEKNQWNAVLRNWIGKTVHIDLVSGTTLIGCLLWVDRYTLGIKDASLRIVHKAAITVITLIEDNQAVIKYVNSNQ